MNWAVDFLWVLNSRRCPASLPLSASPQNLQNQSQKSAEFTGNLQPRIWPPYPFQRGVRRKSACFLGRLYIVGFPSTHSHFSSVALQWQTPRNSVWNTQTPSFFPGLLVMDRYECTMNNQLYNEYGDTQLSAHDITEAALKECVRDCFEHRYSRTQIQLTNCSSLFWILSHGQ